MLSGFLMGVRGGWLGVPPCGRRSSVVLSLQGRRTMGRYNKPSQHENHQGGSAHEEECEESRASSV